MKWIYTYSTSWFRPATFQVLSSHVTSGYHTGQHDSRELQGLETDCSLVMLTTGNDQLTITLASELRRKEISTANDNLGYGWNHRSAYYWGQRRGEDVQSEKRSGSKMDFWGEIILSIVWFWESSNHHNPSMRINLSLFLSNVLMIIGSKLISIYVPNNLWLS